MKKRIFISAILACMSGSIFADVTAAPEIGRFTGNGWVSNNIVVFGGDIMQPMLGNDNGFVYGDVNGDGATNSSWLISPGLGFRYLTNNVIYGMYTYGDYQQTNIGGHLWVVNPGFEIMTPRWDAHVNGYIAPSRTAVNGVRNFADTFGIDEGVLPTGNALEDTPVTPVAVFGSGLDAAFGYSFPYKNNLRARVSLGSYYYCAPTNGIFDVTQNITGVTGGLRLALSPAISVAVNDSYDNVFNNIASLSFSYSFGSKDNDNLYSDDVHDRLLAPNTRHVGILGTGAGQMAQQGYTDVGAEAVQFGDVFYFDPSLPGLSSNQIAGAGLGAIGLGECTAQNPCGNAALNQANIDALDVALPGEAKFFLSTGTFNATGGLTFHEGQEIYGRDTGFATQATGNNRPLLNDGIRLDDGNNIIQSIRVNGKTDFAIDDIVSALTTGYTASGSITVEDSLFTIDPAAASIVRDVLYNGSPFVNMVIDRSTFSAPSITNSSFNAVVYNSAGGNIRINDSTLSLDGSFASSGVTSELVQNENAGVIIINHSTLSNSAAGAGPSVIGVLNLGSATTTIENGSTLALSSSGSVIGLQRYGGDINFIDSTMTVIAGGSGSTHSGTVNASGSTCTVNGSPTSCA